MDKKTKDVKTLIEHQRVQTAEGWKRKVLQEKKGKVVPKKHKSIKNPIRKS